MMDVSVAALEDAEDILGRVDPVVDERPEDDAAIAMDGRLHPLGGPPADDRGSLERQAAAGRERGSLLLGNEI
jgi:hypothetical protein